mmetsp:Transcript_102496/g.182098  ORF Transcript_102496/g.182098 Transcript_102496/m.182098 type:complete len:378 (-) Transcript_102496:184-1317(-)|eukprot:CAMPEP_0197658674 /NCGR_PEP_ID=MMETSP1338-20131121/45374_1 /TAXON_ID=43686 ORGANISM="Pelagodinium beii, Strain RCC1491" /NCGR_SAMPLE_ID=MMETSP1338 /ASSEMBLY_ACC=CAM_ASM_000754 /LENGTH=377 /DNA_ID=CAMNT_0043235299 /DNA_START=46 /DNA_END=1179 /DNA_ORIENTATION=-
MAARTLLLLIPLAGVFAVDQLKKGCPAEGRHSSARALLQMQTAQSQAGFQGPCDIYNAAGTPCVAAHSVVRALYGSYAGPLYVVQRDSDSASIAIYVLRPGGFADSAAQDAFCEGTNCVIQKIFDQSPLGNHVDTAPAGGAILEARQPDSGVNASKHDLWIAGHRVYGAYFEGQMGYRNNTAVGLAQGDDPESMYMVTSGTHYNDFCCFDYGNAERDGLDDGRGTMEAIYWGNGSSPATGWGKGAGEGGPWVKTDLENGLWAGKDLDVTETNTPIRAEFVTAMLKGKAGGMALKGGDAQAGPLKTLFEGSRPETEGYSPMRKQGAIIMGIGGDNSNWGVGTFYEGAITVGYTSDTTDDAVHANIVAAGYGRKEILGM